MSQCEDREIEQHELIELELRKKGNKYVADEI